MDNLITKLSFSGVKRVERDFFAAKDTSHMFEFTQVIVWPKLVYMSYQSNKTFMIFHNIFQNML